MGDKPGHAFRSNQYEGGSARVSVLKEARPPAQAWREPPAPRGKGVKAGGFSATGRTNTEVGDAAEAALEQFGLESAHPGKRQGPLDVTCCNGEWGFEVKALTTDAAEYKVKMKSHEQKGKLEHAKRLGVKPATMIVVMDYAKGEAHAYWREGIGNFRLTPGRGQKEWSYMGTAKVKG